MARTKCSAAYENERARRYKEQGAHALADDMEYALRAWYGDDFAAYIMAMDDEVGRQLVNVMDELRRKK